MPAVPCTVCGADDYVVLFPKRPERGTHQRIVRCRRCDLMYANPQDHVDCDAILAPGAYETMDTEGADRQYFQKQLATAGDYQRMLPVLAQFKPERGKLLEIGSYLGLLLERLRRDGWDTTGLEPCRAGVKYSREKFGLNIVEGILPHPALPAAGFDAVVMCHVIEHMPNPAESVGHIRKLLRPGGLFVVETPRFDSLMFKLLGRRERSLNNCAGHIYFFTVATLSRLLEQNGFEVARVDFVGRTLTIDRFLYNVGLISQSPTVQKWMHRLGARTRLDRQRIYLNLRDMQRLYCRAR